MYPDYLVHFNKLHSKKNGQFISGDGDGDGRGDEHHRYTSSGYSIKVQSQSPHQQQVVNSQQLKLIGGLGKWAAGKAFCATKFGKPFKDGSMNAIGKIFVQSTGLDKIAKDMKLGESISSFKNKAYDKAANKINTTYNNGGLSDADKKKLKVAGIATGAAVAVGAGAYGVKQLKKANNERQAKYEWQVRKYQREHPEKTYYNPSSLVSREKQKETLYEKYQRKKRYKTAYKKNNYLPR